MVISSGRNKSCPLAPPLHQLEPEHTAIKFERAFQIRNFQVHMTNAHSWIDSAEIFAGRKHRVGYQSLITDRQAERLPYNTANRQSGSDLNVSTSARLLQALRSCLFAPRSLRLH